MKATDSITLSPTLTLDAGADPVVVIGANGSGKSSLGVDLANRGAHRISALRGINVPRDIPLQDLARARRERQEYVERQRLHRTQYSTDITHLMNELYAEQLAVAMRIRRDAAQSKDTTVSLDRTSLVTDLDRLKQIWEAHFPQRTLHFEDHATRVIALHRGNAEPYVQDEMSDGERQALYLIAKIASIPDGSVIVVDEPEMHLHVSLARRLWDALEAFRPSSRFIYITHDLVFALGRYSAVFVVCHADGKHERVPTIPDTVAAEILGAISLPLMAGRVFYCEGTSGSLDATTFDAWFNDPEVAVVPVGGCDDVVKAIEGTRLLQSNPAKISGIVDADARCDDELAWLRDKSIHVLPVAEVEHIYCLPEVVCAVLAHDGCDPACQQEKLNDIRKTLVTTLHPLSYRFAFERAQDRIRWELNFPINRVSPGPDGVMAVANLAAAYAAAVAAVNPSSYFAEAEQLVQTALKGDIVDILKSIPSKSVLKVASSACGRSAESYTTLVRRGLRGQVSPQLQQSLRNALKSYLPL